MLKSAGEAGVIMVTVMINRILVEGVFQQGKLLELSELF